MSPGSPHEKERIAALRRYNILDTLPEETFDRLTRLASMICDVPITLMSLIDEDRQWLKSKFGIEDFEIARDISFCHYAVASEGSFTIEDAIEDSRFSSNPMVTGEPHIRFYSAEPLVDPDGYILGTLCVIDRVPRKLNATQQDALKTLAEEVMSQIAARKERIELEKVKKALNAKQTELGTLISSLHVGVVVQKPDLSIYMCNQKSLELLGLTENQLLGKTSFDPDWNVIHPDGKPFPGETHPAVEAVRVKQPIRNVVMGVYRPRLKDRIWILVSAEPHLDEMGEVLLVTVTFTDISDQISYEKKLEKSEIELHERLAQIDALVTSVDDFVFEIDANYRYINAWAHNNENFLLPKEQVLGKTLSDLFGQEASKEFETLIDKAIGENIPQQIEFPSLIDGNQWYNASIRKLKNPIDAIPTVCVVVKNITERKKELDRMRMLESVFSHSKDAILIAEAEPVDQPGPKIIYANKAFTEMTEYSLEELYQNTPRILQGPKSERKELDKIRHALKNWQTVQAELVNYTKSGKEFWVNLMIVPVANEEGWFTHWVSIQRDMTATKEAEKELRNVALFPAENPNPVLRISKEGLLQYANKAAQEQLSPWQLNLNAPPIKEVEKLVREVFEKRSTHVVELKVSEKVFDVIISYMTHEEYVNIYATDVTSRKLMEDGLRKAKIEAESANTAKSAFLANMSHEIRTPLNSVIGFSELLMKTRLSENQKEYMKSVYNSAHTLLDLINDVLDFSKIEAGKMEVYPEKTDIYRLLEGVLEVAKLPIYEKGLELLLDIAPNVPRFAWIDAVRIRQVLMNLVSNAAKFTHRGEIEIAISFYEGTKCLEFAVKDTGIGISGANQKRIFESFLQEDASTTRKYGGTGLGLSISNSLLRLMGSDLQLKSELDRGSRFWFELTVDTEEDPLDVPVSVKSLKHVMLLEGNKRNRSIMTGMFEQLNITADVYQNSIEALEGLQKKWHQYDVLLIDYHLPYMNGIETINKIRSELQIPANELPVLLLHRLTDSRKIQEEAKHLSVNKTISKSLSLDELIKALVSVVQQKHSSISTDELDTDSSLFSQIRTEADKRGTFSVLVVDDNAINRNLAKNMIRSFWEEAQVMEAENGLEAVRSWKQSMPNLILMDVQMPEMSGYEATAKIRELEKGQQRVPIVALTAGTVEGERERCFAAGMDDYLSKPISLELLEATLNKYLTLAHGSGQNATVFLEFRETEFQHFNREVLLKRLNGREDMVEDILTLIRSGALHELVARVEKSIEENNIREFKSATHSLKGASKSACFELMGELADQLEATEGDPDTSIAILAKVKTELAFLAEEIG